MRHSEVLVKGLDRLGMKLKVFGFLASKRLKLFLLFVSRAKGLVGQVGAATEMEKIQITIKIKISITFKRGNKIYYGSDW